MNAVLVSPAEPAEIRALGVVSAQPERWGVDVVWAAPCGLCGVQRKTWSDLLASVSDGRLARELGQMRASPLAVVVLLVEGRVSWSVDGVLLRPETVRAWTRRQVRGLLHSVRAEGAWVDWTDDVTDTCSWLVDFRAWTAKAEHRSLRARPPVERNSWGTRGCRAWEEHLLQSFPGVSVVRARAIIDHLGLPLAWTVTEKDLASVPSIGAKTAKRLIAALDRTAACEKGGEAHG